MTIQRRSKFGFPPQPNQGSTMTTRLVPLSQGVNLDVAWPLLPPGSTISMSNFLPLDGVLRPRSRLSSLNTIRMPTVSVAINGINELPSAIENVTTIWLSSDATQHATLESNGSLSRASFVSSFGLGVASLVNQDQWQYAPVYMSNLGENVLLAAGNVSHDTILALYRTGGAANGAPLFSYLTSAPKTMAVATYDNYVVAFNVSGAATRVQWCVRGNPSNWTSEGSGFEDLLAMRGSGRAVRSTTDGRMILFGDMEIWYATGAAYPAQFQFLPLDQSIGCPFPATIQECDLGLIFLGSDRHLRILPRGGGRSTVIAPQVALLLRTLVPLDSSRPSCWGVYDQTNRLYHLFIEIADSDFFRGLVVNIDTGEWGFMDYNATTPTSGFALTHTRNPFGRTEGVLFGNSTGTVFSFSSLVNTENGVAVPAVWQSAPIAADMAGNYKQITQVDIDYRSTSTGTLSMQFSQTGGNSVGNAVTTVATPVAPVSGRATAQVYVGGAFPAIKLYSTSTGYELHRLDVTMDIGGRK